MAGYEEYEQFLAELEQQCQPKPCWSGFHCRTSPWPTGASCAPTELQTTETKDVWANEWFDRLLRYSNLAQRHWQSAWEALQRALAQSALQPSAAEPPENGMEAPAEQPDHQPEGLTSPNSEGAVAGDFVAAAEPTNCSA